MMGCEFPYQGISPVFGLIHLGDVVKIGDVFLIYVQLGNDTNYFKRTIETVINSSKNLIESFEIIDFVFIKIL